MAQATNSSDMSTGQDVTPIAMSAEGQSMTPTSAAGQSSAMMSDGRGSGWNDPPACRFGTHTTPPTGSTGPPRRHPLHRRAHHPAPIKTSDELPGTSPTPHDNHGLLASDVQSSPSTCPGKIQLFPPSTCTDPSPYTAPIIIPTMTSGGVADGVAVATNPVTSTPVAIRALTTDADLDVPEFEDDEQMYHYVVTRLQRALKDSQLRCDSRAVDEMHKKVNIFSDMWKNGKISYPVKSTMARLATAIHRRRCEVANELHLSLMVDHVSEVSKWLVGIKRLIQEVQNVEAPMSPGVMYTKNTISTTTTTGCHDDAPASPTATSPPCSVSISGAELQQTTNNNVSTDTKEQVGTQCDGLSGSELVVEAGNGFEMVDGKNLVAPVSTVASTNLLLNPPTTAESIIPVCSVVSTDTFPPLLSTPGLVPESFPGLVPEELSRVSSLPGDPPTTLTTSLPSDQVSSPGTAEVGTSSVDDTLSQRVDSLKLTRPTNTLTAAENNNDGNVVN